MWHRDWSRDRKLRSFQKKKKHHRTNHDRLKIIKKEIVTRSQLTKPLLSLDLCNLCRPSICLSTPIISKPLKSLCSDLHWIGPSITLRTSWRFFSSNWISAPLYLTLLTMGLEYLWSIYDNNAQGDPRQGQGKRLPYASSQN